MPNDRLHQEGWPSWPGYPARDGLTVVKRVYCLFFIALFLAFATALGGASPSSAATKRWLSNSKLVDKLNTRLRWTLQNILLIKGYDYHFDANEHQDFAPVKKVYLSGIKDHEIDYVSYQLALSALEAIYGYNNAREILLSHHFTDDFKDYVGKTGKKDHFESLLASYEEIDESDDAIQFPMTTDEFYKMTKDKSGFVDFISRNWVTPPGELTTGFVNQKEILVLSQEEIDRRLLQRVNAAVAALGVKGDLTATIRQWDLEWQAAMSGHKHNTVELIPKKALALQPAFARVASETDMYTLSSTLRID